MSFETVFFDAPLLAPDFGPRPFDFDLADERLAVSTQVAGGGEEGGGFYAPFRGWMLAFWREQEPGIS